jgi:hypothetical protein
MAHLVTAQTNNADQNAVFGRNDANNAGSGTGVHGAGVFGLSLSPGAAGVFGAQNSDNDLPPQAATRIVRGPRI